MTRFAVGGEGFTHFLHGVFTPSSRCRALCTLLFSVKEDYFITITFFTSTVWSVCDYSPSNLPIVRAFFSDEFRFRLLLAAHNGGGTAALFLLLVIQQKGGRPEGL